MDLFWQNARSLNSLFTMNPLRSSYSFALVGCLCSILTAFAEPPKLPGIGAAMEQMVEKNEIAGAVTVVVTKQKIVHLECTGYADIASKRPMTPDTLFWIA